MYNIPEIDDFFLYGVQSFEKQDSYFYKGVSAISIVALVYLTFLFLRVNKIEKIEKIEILEDKESV